MIVFVIPRLLSFQPELFNIPWHLCATSVSSSLCAVALAGGSSVRGVSPWTLSLHNRLFHLPICIVKGGYTVSPPSPPALEVAFVSRWRRSGWSVALCQRGSG